MGGPMGGGPLGGVGSKPPMTKLGSSGGISASNPMGGPMGGIGNPMGGIGSSLGGGATKPKPQGLTI
jgi:hypothetical protein